MKRRSFLQLLGFSAAAPAIAKLPELQKPTSVLEVPPSLAFEKVGTYVGDGKEYMTVELQYGFRPKLIILKSRSEPGDWKVIQCAAPSADGK